MQSKLSLILLIGIIGCASVPPSQIMFNPTTGNTVICNKPGYWGTGFFGLAMGSLIADESQKNQIESLKKIGFVEAEKVGLIGIAFEGKKLTDSLKIAQVYPDKPAAKAGIKPGDIVIERDKIPVKTVGELYSIPFLKPGQTSEWKILREEKVLIFTIICESAINLKEENQP